MACAVVCQSFHFSLCQTHAHARTHTHTHTHINKHAHTHAYAHTCRVYDYLPWRLICSRYCHGTEWELKMLQQLCYLPSAWQEEKRREDIYTSTRLGDFWERTFERDICVAVAEIYIYFLLFVYGSSFKNIQQCNSMVSFFLFLPKCSHLCPHHNILQSQAKSKITQPVVQLSFSGPFQHVWPDKMVHKIY